MLSCRDLVKICNAQINFSKNEDYKSMSEDEFVYSSVGVCAYNRLAEIIEQVDKEEPDTEKKNMDLECNIWKMFGKFQTSNYILSTAWDNAVLNIYKLATDGIDNMTHDGRKYIEDIINS